MGSVYLFVPENDMALAANSVNYIPKRGAWQMHLDGSLLPLWWANNDDVVISPKIEEADVLKKSFNLKGNVKEFIDPETLSSIDNIAPWGWSYYTRSLLIKSGIPPEMLPADKELDDIRQLSHRSISIEVSKRLNALDEFDDLPPTPKLIIDTASLEEKECYIKLPWSSSARGIRHLTPVDFNEKTLRDIEGMIRHQGGVIQETALDKVYDFAALFYSDVNGVHYRGLSLFSNNSRGAYCGNIVDDEDALREMLSKYISIERYDQYISALEKILSEIICGKYVGWLGVDMMVYKTADGNNAIAPCIEVNLRMTMGVVAHLIRENPIIKPMLPCRFSIESESEGRDGTMLCGGTPYQFMVLKCF